MNKRINDLMYHAGLTAQGCWDNMDDYDREAILKLAELIIQQCAYIAGGYFGPGRNPQQAIKEYFGVEE